MSKRAFSLVSAAALAALAGGCRTGLPVRFQAVGEMVHLSERGEVPREGEVWDDSIGAVMLFASANETVGFQMVLDAAEPVGGLRITAGALSNADGATIPAEGMSLFRMMPRPVDRFPAWRLRLAEGPVEPMSLYDALVPINVPPAEGERPRIDRFDLSAGQRLAIWADVSVPRDAPPGEYKGTLTIQAGLKRAVATIVVRVYDIVLPDHRPIACIGGFSHEQIFRRFVGSGVPVRMDTDSPDVKAALVAIRALMRLAHEHRLDLFDRDLRPLLKRDGEGRPQLRWEDYDAIVKPYLDGTAFDDRIGVGAWPSPLSAAWPDPGDYDEAGADAYRRTVLAVRDQVAEHFRQLGADERLFVWPRTPAGPRAYEDHMTFAAMMGEAGARPPILTELPPSAPAETLLKAPTGFAATADMFAAPGNLFDYSKSPASTGAGGLAGVYLRPGAPPYVAGLDALAFPADVRALGWLAMKYGCRGVFVPDALGWDDEGAGRLFHAVDGRAVASVRLKWLRRGLQDAAYLWLLGQRERQAVARTFIDTMVHYAGLSAAGDNYLDPRLDGWVRHGPLWRDARRLLAEEVLAAVHPKGVTEVRSLERGLLWKQLGQRACRVRVERVRSRLLEQTDGRFAADVTVELFNELTIPVAVEVAAGTLPPGWAASADRGRASLAAGARGSITVRAVGDAPRTGPDGKMPINLTLSIDVPGRAAEGIVAKAPWLRAGWVDREFTIDGRLDDWPLRPGNAAGDFVLLGRRGRVGDGLARRQTVVLALHDEKNLYLAFRCDEPRPEGLRALPNNLLRHDQLMARDEDLVEVIFDPTGKASSPEELYHLTVKCNGVVIAARGVRTDPPLGKALPWPVPAKAAVGMLPGVWIVEMAVPLASFGDDAGGRFWSVNFGRFAKAGEEASNWAGAERYLYDPGSLGTLYLEPPPARGSQ